MKRPTERQGLTTALISKQVGQIGLYTGMGFVNFYRRRRGNTFFWIVAAIIFLIGLGLARVL